MKQNVLSLSVARAGTRGGGLLRRPGGRGMTRAAIAVAALVLLQGCAILPTPSTSLTSCDLLDTAMDEGQQFAEAWYLRAGPVLAWCGKTRAMERAKRGACAARRFNDTTVECP